MDLSSGGYLLGGLAATLGVAGFFRLPPFGVRTAPATPKTGDFSATTTLAIGGMHCAACVGRVERATKKLDGVGAATVDLLGNQGTFSYDPARTEPETLALAIQNIGFEASVPTESAPTAPPKAPTSPPARFWLALALTLPVFAGEMGGHIGLAVPAVLQNHWLQLVLTLPVVLGAGREFFIGAAGALRQRDADMDALVALGTGSALLWSVGVTVSPHALGHHAYFESAGVIVTLILLGRFLEARAKGRTGEALARLLSLAPSVAHKIDENGTERDVAPETLKPGERIRLRPGERVPLDGVVIDGSSELDESLLTGEPLPVAKTTGDWVSAGTTNGAGALLVEVAATGAGTTLARIVRAVRRAQASRAPLQRLADRITRIFVPTVLIVAVLTLSVALALGVAPLDAFSRFLAVLTIACPCALGLATPTSIAVAMGRGAERGILFRSADALERAAEISHVLLDKTGTLTLGKPSVERIEPVAPWTEETLLRTLAAAESPSEHPLARAVVREAERRNLALPEASGFRATIGRGIEAVVEGKQVRAGIAEFVEPSAPKSGEGTPVHVSVDGIYAGAAWLADTVRPEASEAIAALKKLAIGIGMVTGDRRAPAESVARAVGIADVFAEVLPEEKAAEVVRQREKTGGKLAFVGDGINDAPALAKADLGIAMGGGADVALETADVALGGGSLSALPEAFALARATRANIRGNLFFAFAYNIVGIPLAALGKLDPMLAALAMALSSVSVVTNALRLRRFTPRR